MLKLLKKFTRRDLYYALLAVVFIVVQVWLDMTMPDYMSEITVLVETQGSAMSEIWRAGAMMMLCAFGSLAASAVTAVLTAKIGSNIAAQLRSKLFKKVQTFSMEEVGRFSVAGLITRSTNDVQQVLMLIVMGLQMLIKAPITAGWAITKIAGTQWQWTMSVAVAVGVLLVVIGICTALTMPKYRKIQELIDNLNRVTRENLSGLRVVRAYNAEKYQEDKFEDANASLTRTQLFTQSVMSFMMPSMQIIMSALSLSVYWIGAHLLNNAASPVERIAMFGDMMVFTQYAMTVVSSFMMLVMIFMMLPRASVSVKRVNEVFDTVPAIVNGDICRGKEGLEGEIEFKNVSFRYPDAEEDVLQNISFRAKKGETVAFIGSTGCGKSTLVNLIPRFYDVSEGEVLFDGVDVKKWDEKELRRKIAYVSQKATLFSGTIRSNIAYGDNECISDEKVEKALEIAQASEFVSGLEGGLDAHVAQGGGNFSGGQKQRLSIARAVARDAEVIIFDDSFSALDYKTDRTLRHRLNEACASVTRLIVAQRIGTIRDADLIVVLDDGKVAGMGKHAELMENCEVYRQIALSQLSKEELA